jgi:hypothetical protein
MLQASMGEHRDGQEERTTTVERSFARKFRC